MNNSLKRICSEQETVGKKQHQEYAEYMRSGELFVLRNERGICFTCSRCPHCNDLLNHTGCVSCGTKKCTTFGCKIFVHGAKICKNH
jgi:hypothetical protein